MLKKRKADFFGEKKKIVCVCVGWYVKSYVSVFAPCFSVTGKPVAFGRKMLQERGMLNSPTDDH